MKTVEINTKEEAVSLSLIEETEYISKTTDISYDTVLRIIKGIDAYYYLMGIQDELTFEDEEEMFIDGGIQLKKYVPDIAIDDEELIAFISMHTHIPNDIIEKVMIQDLKYQNII